MIDYRVPIEIEGVRVLPGDIVFGDLDGVLVIPQGIEAEVLGARLRKGEAGEKTVGEAIRAGMSASEAFRIHGVM